MLAAAADLIVVDAFLGGKPMVGSGFVAAEGRVGSGTEIVERGSDKVVVIVMVVAGVAATEEVTFGGHETGCAVVLGVMPVDVQVWWPEMVLAD